MIKKIKSTTPLSGVYFIYQGSVNLEIPGNRGISHIIEHLLCRSLGSIKNKFFLSSIDYSAWTSDNEVVIHFTGLWEKLKLYLPDIISILSEPKLTSSYIDSEKKIILQEWDEWFLDINNWIQGSFTRKILGSSGPIGERGDIEEISQLEIIKFWEKNFTKPSSIILIAPEMSYHLDNDLLSGSPPPKKPWSLIDDGVSNLPQIDMGDTRTILMYSQMIDEDFAWLNFINIILSRGGTSLLFKKVRNNKSLIYRISSKQYRYNRNSIIRIKSATNKDNTNELEKSIKEVLSNLPSLIDQKMIDRAKKHLITRKQIERINRYNNVKDLIDPKSWDVYKILDDITLQNVQQKASIYFGVEKFKVFSISK